VGGEENSGHAYFLGRNKRMHAATHPRSEALQLIIRSAFFLINNKDGSEATSNDTYYDDARCNMRGN
jgi:hypothetical protein